MSFYQWIVTSRHSYPLIFLIGLLMMGTKVGEIHIPWRRKIFFTKCCTSPLSVGRWAVASRLASLCSELLPYRIRNITYNFLLYIQDVNACLPLPVQNRLSQAVMSILQMHLRRTQQQMKDGFCQNLKLNNNIDSHHVPDIQKKKSTEDHQKPVEWITFFFFFKFFLNLTALSSLNAFCASSWKWQKATKVFVFSFVNNSTR